MPLGADVPKTYLTHLPVRRIPVGLKQDPERIRLAYVTSRCRPRVTNFPSQPTGGAEGRSRDQNRRHRITRAHAVSAFTTSQNHAGHELAGVRAT